MQKHIARHLKQQLAHLYISPLSRCNLNCKICYTKKSKQQLSFEQITDFIGRYQQYSTLQSVTFCGGEVFLLDYFVSLVNYLTAQKILVQIISNGTIDQLDKLKDPNWINLVVSLDGLPAYHEKNRGAGTAWQSLGFLKKAVALGFNVAVFSIITLENYEQIFQFETWLEQELGFLPDITYHPRKNLNYLNNHSVDNNLGAIEGFSFLPLAKKIALASSKQVFPARSLGCYQLALNSSGLVYPCCEATEPLGKITHNINYLVDQLAILLESDFNLHCSKKCLGCSQVKFICGLEKDYVY